MGRGKGKKSEGVTVTLDYNKGRGRRKGSEVTISFPRPQRNCPVLEAKAGLVAGVNMPLMGLTEPGQELTFSITDYHNRTRAQALAVVKRVVKALGLKVEGDIHVQSG